MTSFNMKFVLVEFPSNEDEARRLSTDMTIKHGLDGWQLVSASVLATDRQRVLLLALQR